MSAGLDLHGFLLTCLGRLVQTTVEPRCQNVPLWNSGLKEIASAKLTEMGVPEGPIPIVDIARAAGILGPDPNVIVVNPSRKRPRRNSYV